MNISIVSVHSVQKMLSALAIFAMVFSPLSPVFALSNNANGGGNGGANPSANLDQAENGPANSPIDPAHWVNGAVNENNGHYAEGESIPYRIKLDNLTPNQQNTLIIEFDVLKSQGQTSKFAVDYITSNDRISEVVSPCLNIVGCAGAPSDTIDIPAPGYAGSMNGYGSQDVLDSFNELEASEGPQVMKIWNGSLDSVAYTVQPNLAVNDKAQVTIKFTPSSVSSVISWGGHISSSLDYPGESAVMISGSPYHTRLISLDGQGGNQDMALSASAVEYPGNLIVVKHVVGGTKTAGDFTINVTASDTVSPSQFTGSEDGTGVTIDVPQNGTSTYSVSEVVDPSYTVAYSTDCIGTIVALQQKICTITNTYVPPIASLTLVKSVNNDAGGLATANQWTLSADGVSTDLSGAGGASGTVAPGTYTLSETGSVARYQAGAWQCTDGTLVGDQLTLENGDNATCTITNTYVPADKASITVVKEVINDNGGTADAGTFKYFVNGVTEIFHNIAKMFDAETPTQFTLTETNTTGYTPSVWGGACATNGTVTLSEGGSAICTITNDDIAPSITITKVVNNGTSKTPKIPSQFDIVLTANDINGIETDDTKTFAGNGAGSVFTFDAGSYAVTEPSHSGYTVDFSAGCSGTAVLDQDITCTVTNTFVEPTISTVTFTKVVDNDFGGTAVPSDFSFHVDGTNVDVQVAHGASTQLPLGTYTVTESGPNGYSASYSTFCSGGDFVIGADDLGEARECVITNNDIQPTLTVIKHVINDNDTANDVDKLAGDFTMNVSGTNVSESSFAGNEAGEVITLNAGAYEVTEGAHDGYSDSYSPDCAGTIAIGEHRTCTVTNNDIPPTEAVITITKVLVNNYGGTATPDDFSFTMNGIIGADPLFSFAAIDANNGSKEVVVANGGDHRVTETSAPGYRISYSPSCDALANVELGWSYSCQITNTELPQCSDGIDNDGDEFTDYRGEDPGCTDGDDDDETDPVTSITIDKVVNGEGANAGQSFSFDYSWTGALLDASLSANDTPITAVVKPAQGLVITEKLDGLSRWNVESISCTTESGTVPQSDLDNNPDSVTLNLSLGEQISCVFTNHYTPRDSGTNDEFIVVKKAVTAGSDTSVDFGFDVSWFDALGDADFLLKSGGEFTSNELASDELYSISETELPVGWSLDGASCVSSKDSERVIANPSVPFLLNDGETITCTFTNDQDRYVLEGFVWHDANENDIWEQINNESEDAYVEEDLAGWTVRATNGSVILTTTTDENGYYSFNVPAGTWTITETLQNDWAQTFPNDGTHVVIVPEIVTVNDSFFGSIVGMFMPTAHAATIGTYGLFNFGNVFTGCVSDCGGGGGGSSSGSRRRSSNNDQPAGEVLGEATSALPVGAPNTGAGGSQSTQLPVLLAILASGTAVRKTK